MKPKKNLSKKMFAITASNHLSSCHLSDLMAFQSEAKANVIVNQKIETIQPIVVLSVDPENYERMVAQAAVALAINHGHPWGGVAYRNPKHVWRKAAQAALKSIGIKELSIK
jgi:hypothetical protein